MENLPLYPYSVTQPCLCSLAYDEGVGGRLAHCGRMRARPYNAVSTTEGRRLRDVWPSSRDDVIVWNLNSAPMHASMFIRV